MPITTGPTARLQAPPVTAVGDAHKLVRLRTFERLLVMYLLGRNKWQQQFQRQPHKQAVSVEEAERQSSLAIFVTITAKMKKEC
jgi:hypothetical protein